MHAADTQRTHMNARFSILQILELTAVIGITLAFDALVFRNHRYLPDPELIVACGSLTGTYLAYRWARKRDFFGLLRMACIWTAGLTLLNVIRIGFLIASRLEANQLSAWTYNWHRPVIAAGQVIVFAVAFSALLMAGVYWASKLSTRRQPS